MLFILFYSYSDQAHNSFIKTILCLEWSEPINFLNNNLKSITALCLSVSRQ
jgi:hypothetical protein